MSISVTKVILFFDICNGKIKITSIEVHIFVYVYKHINPISVYAAYKILEKHIFSN